MGLGWMDGWMDAQKMGLGLGFGGGALGFGCVFFFFVFIPRGLALKMFGRAWDGFFGSLGGCISILGVSSCLHGACFWGEGGLIHGGVEPDVASRKGSRGPASTRNSAKL